MSLVLVSPCPAGPAGPAAPFFSEVASRLRMSSIALSTRPLSSFSASECFRRGEGGIVLTVFFSTIVSSLKLSLSVFARISFDGDDPAFSDITAEGLTRSTE